MQSPPNRLVLPHSVGAERSVGVGVGEGVVARMWLGCSDCLGWRRRWSRMWVGDLRGMRRRCRLVLIMGRRMVGRVRGRGRYSVFRQCWFALWRRVVGARGYLLR